MHNKCSIFDKKTSKIQVILRKVINEKGGFI